MTIKYTVKDLTLKESCPHQTHDSIFSVFETCLASHLFTIRQ